MLFTQQTEHLNSAISGIQNEIDELENKLIQLREEKANLEAEKQTILTLESAAESAIAQCQNFIGAADSLQRSDLLETFWTALDALKIFPAGQLSQATDTPTAPTDHTPKTPHTPLTIDVTPDSTHRKNDIDTKQPLNGKKPALSIGSAAFDPSQASLDELKNFVRSHQTDDDTKQLGKLTKRSTWVKAAQQILGRIEVETQQ